MFKFYKISEIDLVEKLIGNNPSLKFSNPGDLNDPFELKFILSINPNHKKHKQLYFKVNKFHDENDYNDWKDSITDNNGFNWFHEQKIRKMVSEEIQLCSFSKINNSSLMWAHYADKFAGICIEYDDELFEDLKQQNGFFAYGKVKYSISPPVLTDLFNYKVIIEKILFHKQKEWFYENEYRVIYKSEISKGLINIQKKYLKGIYIGPFLNSEIENEVFRIASIQNIPIYHAIVVGNTYKVLFEKHDENVILTKSFWNKNYH